MKRNVSYEWNVVVEQCKDLLAELADLPEHAEDFVAGVEETVLGIQEWIETYKIVTRKQQKALENIEQGVQKWKKR